MLDYLQQLLLVLSNNLNELCLLFLSMGLIFLSIALNSYNKKINKRLNTLENLKILKDFLKHETKK